ncbi:hypothetical protein EDC01DRAFT_163503 [Geopyxis carbonaria]|nr:hypothetical protein EDC01DRAFT_163503 [Geopyxis carbonaria]
MEARQTDRRNRRLASVTASFYAIRVSQCSLLGSVLCMLLFCGCFSVRPTREVCTDTLRELRGEGIEASHPAVSHPQRSHPTTVKHTSASMPPLPTLLHESSSTSASHHRQRTQQRTQHFTTLHDPYSGALISRRPHSPLSDEFSDVSSSSLDGGHGHSYHYSSHKHRSSDLDDGCCRRTDVPPCETAMTDAVRRNHRKLDLVNRGIHANAVFSQVHPKMRGDGTYPADFLVAKTVDEFETLDVAVIDRILKSYGLLCGTRELMRRSGREPERPAGRGREEDREVLRRRKLNQLYEFLGADQLAGFVDDQGVRQDRGWLLS